MSSGNLHARHCDPIFASFASVYASFWVSMRSRGAGVGPAGVVVSRSGASTGDSTSIGSNTGMDCDSSSAKEAFLFCFRLAFAWARRAPFAAPVAFFASRFGGTHFTQLHAPGFVNVPFIVEFSIDLILWLFCTREGDSKFKITCDVNIKNKVSLIGLLNMVTTGVKKSGPVQNPRASQKLALVYFFPCRAITANQIS